MYPHRPVIWDRRPRPEVNRTAIARTTSNSVGRGKDTTPIRRLPLGRNSAQAALSASSRTRAERPAVVRHGTYHRLEVALVASSVGLARPPGVR